jgi:hypothetical protein
MAARAGICRSSLIRRSRAGWGFGPAGEVEQVAAFGVVELKRPGDALEDGVRGTGQVAAFHPDVVVDADPGEHRDLLPAQSCHPAVAAVGGQAGLLRGNPRPPGGEELADLRSVVHDFTVDAPGAPREALPLPGRAGTPPDRASVNSRIGGTVLARYWQTAGVRRSPNFLCVLPCRLPPVAASRLIVEPERPAGPTPSSPVNPEDRGMSLCRSREPGRRPHSWTAAP